MANVNNAKNSTYPYLKTLETFDRFQHLNGSFSFSHLNNSTPFNHHHSRTPPQTSPSLSMDHLGLPAPCTPCCNPPPTHTLLFTHVHCQNKQFEDTQISPMSQSGRKPLVLTRLLSVANRTRAVQCPQGRQKRRQAITHSLHLTNNKTQNIEIGASHSVAQRCIE